MTLSHEASVRILWRRQNDEANGRVAPRQCPRCQAPETTEHVLVCPETAAGQVWETSVREFGALKSVRTDPRLVRKLCVWLLAWPKGQEYDGARAGPLAQAAVEEQFRLGWRAMVEGIISKK
jgi:hypothetical protein